MTREPGRGVLLLDEQAIFYRFGIGVFPSFCFGTLSLTDEELAFKADNLPWTHPLQRYPLRIVAHVCSMPPQRTTLRRLVWLLGIAISPVTGLAGLPWLKVFWPRAGGATLEVCTRRRILGGRRVFIIRDPVMWAEAINRLIAATGDAANQKERS